MTLHAPSFGASRNLALTLAISLAMSQRLAAESVVAVGAGKMGSWDTVVELANPTSSPLLVQVGADAFFEGACPMQCPFTQVTVPPLGSVTLHSAEIFHTVLDGIYTLYVIPADGVTLPVVRARVFDAAVPLQAVELPAVRLASTTGDGSLAFPSVRRTTAAHSNLLLTNVDTSGPLLVTVELYSVDGQRLGGMDLSIDPGVVEFLVDVAARLGVSNLENGQLVVTKTGNLGTPWGEVATVDSINGVIISVGRNP